jgi:4-hydroxy-2-oxoheptanedioate aldolase
VSTAETLRNAAHLHGLWSITGHPAVIDAAASVGPDFVCVDTQHGVPLGALDASLFTVLASYGVPGLVRVDSIDRVPIGRALDLGAAGVIVPQVDTADEARSAVAATRYAPVGGRSFGMQTRRVGPFAETPYVVIQVETAGSVDAIDEIAAVEGVDCLYIGPADLGLGLGGSPAQAGAVLDGSAPNGSQMRTAFTAVIEAGRRRGVRTGVHCLDGGAAARANQEGFTFTAVAVDLSLMTSGLAAELERARAGSV